MYLQQEKKLKYLFLALIITCIVAVKIIFLKKFIFFPKNG